MGFNESNRLNAYIINPIGDMKVVNGHNIFVLNYLKSINPLFTDFTESDITENIKGKVLRLGFVRISEFADLIIIDLYTKINLKQIKSVDDNIPSDRKYLVELNYVSDKAKVFYEKKELINYLFSIT